MKTRVKIADIIIYIIMIALCFVTLYPFIYTLSYSFSNGHEVLTHPITFLPVKPTLANYQAAFNNNKIARSFFISASRTFLGLSYTLIVTGMAAYMLSKRFLPGNRFFSYFFIIPMYISGGMIATFVNISHLHLMNKFLVYILPHGFVAYYMLIIRTYFMGIPDSLEESAPCAFSFRLFCPSACPYLPLLDSSRVLCSGTPGSTRFCTFPIPTFSPCSWFFKTC